MSSESSTTNDEEGILATYGTHIAAVGVGVLVTLLVVGKAMPLSSQKKQSTAATPAATSSTKKKKKNNKKKKPAAAGGQNGSTSSATRGVVPAPEQDETKSQVSFDETDETPAPAPQASNTTSTGKKKKKNKKKNGSNGSQNNNNNEKPAATQNGSTAATTMTPALAAAPPAPADFYDYNPQQMREQEEVWETIPNKGSKGSNKRKNKAISTAVKAASGKTNAAAPTKASETVTIDASKVGIIIGPKGATMQAIQTKTGCKLDVSAPDKDQKVNPRSMTQKLKATVVISEGDAAAMNKAKQAVLELASRGYATLLQADTFGESSMQVHPKCLAEIVGPSGSTIQAIQNTLQVKITIPKTDWKPNTPQIGNVEPSCKVGIAGDDKQNVKAAKQCITDLLKYHHTAVTHPGMIHETVHIPSEFIHVVVGKRGSEIKHIKGNYKVQVYIENENCIVVGKQANVDKAIAYIQLLMDRDSEQRAQKYSDEFYG